VWINSAWRCDVIGAGIWEVMNPVMVSMLCSDSSLLCSALRSSPRSRICRVESQPLCSTLTAAQLSTDVKNRLHEAVSISQQLWLWLWRWRRCVNNWPEAEAAAAKSESQFVRNSVWFCSSRGSTCCRSGHAHAPISTINHMSHWLGRQRTGHRLDCARVDTRDQALNHAFGPTYRATPRPTHRAQYG
jgi:hypothetical protein